MKPSVKDANLAVSLALPAGATTVVVAAGLDIGPVTPVGNFAPSIEGEFMLEAPALTTVQLPDTTTVTYDIICSASASLGSPVVVRKAALVQTGAGGAGAAAPANPIRFRPTTDSLRYFGFQITGVATVAATGATAKLTYVV